MAKTKTEKPVIEKIEKPVKSMSVSKSKLFFLVSLVVLALLAFRFKSLFIAATVNGQPISRISLIKQLEKEGGKTVLDSLITNSLVLQEAQKEKVTASSSEISAQIDQITNSLKAQGQDINAALAAQGMTRNDLNDQIKLQILVQKMAGKDITVTDKEISDYFDQNKAAYPKGAKLADESAQIKTTLMQQKTNTAITTWLTNLKSKAKINYWVSY